MHLKNHILTFVTGAAIGVMATSAHAALIVYEGFDYPQQTGLATQSGGTGWASCSARGWMARKSV